jgi:hypothetical protein
MFMALFVDFPAAFATGKAWLQLIETPDTVAV